MAGIEHTTLISQPGSQSGQPRFKISLPVQTLQGLESGQAIPMVQVTHFLAKTNNGHYQILEIDEAKNSTAILTPTINNGLKMSYPSTNSTVNTGFNSTINKNPTIATGPNTQPSTSTLLKILFLKKYLEIKQKECMKRKQENDHPLVEPPKKTNTGESN